MAAAATTWNSEGLKVMQTDILYKAKRSTHNTQLSVQFLLFLLSKLPGSRPCLQLCVGYIILQK